MAPSPVKFLFLLLIVSALGWFVFIFASRLLAWLLSRTMGASVGFRVAGCNCLRDVVVKFKKGAVESVCIGEIKLSLRKSLVRLGCSFISRDPKLQLLISDLEVVIRAPEKSSRKAAHRSRSSGRGKWIFLTNIARFLSVSVTDLAVKVPKATVEVRELSLDISKDGGSIPILSVKIYLLPFLVHMGEWRFSCDQPSGFTQEGPLLPGQESLIIIEKNAPFCCEELSLICEFGHERELGVTVKNVDVTCGEVTVNLNEDLFLKKHATAEPFIDVCASGQATLEPVVTKTTKQKGSVLPSLKKYMLGFPEKVSFNLPNLGVKFLHRGQNLLVENNIMGIHLRSSKSQNFEDLGESTSHFDVQMDFSEIHLLREGNTSVMEILKVAVISSLDVPMQPTVPVRAEIDLKLGGTQCNIIMSRLTPWMNLHLSKKKRIVLSEENSDLGRSQEVDVKAIMWTCTLSAPEMTIVLYSLSGEPLYHGCSQSSHIFANNIACMGIAVHTELGELHLHMADEYQECLKESLFGVDTNSGSLMHIARVSLDWGRKEMESLEGFDPSCQNLVFSIDVTGMGLYFDFRRLESLISSSLTFQALLKSLSASRKMNPQNRVSRPSKPTSGGHILKLSLERCSVNFSGEVGMENTMVADPKRVNFGSQGGEVVISVSADGTPRRAIISGEGNQLKYALSLDIFHFSLSVDKENHCTQIELERARSFYREYFGEGVQDAKVTLLDMQNAKFVRRSGGPIAICSLFSATDIAVRWEPDVHLSLYEFVLRLQLLFHNHNLRNFENGTNVDLVSGEDLKSKKKRGAVFAVDVEMLSISSELADGVEAMIKVESIFTENARIGILLEGLTLSFNEAQVFRCSRMQISRVPNVPGMHSSSDAKSQAPVLWDWVIQGLDLHICMPYRLQFRAIEDAVEDTLRGLKLIIAAKTNMFFPMKKKSLKPGKPKSSKFGSVKFSIRKFTAEIEEEPIQGWLDEHYKIMKNEVCELGVRLKFLDEILSEGNRCSGSCESNDPYSEKKILHNGTEIDLTDSSAIEKLREEVQKQAFRSYYQACKKMVPSEGSGACTSGFQAGFKPSSARNSLLSLIITELDLTLTKIGGGNMGMVELIKKLDPICMDNDIPFSRLLGRNVVVQTGSLVVQLRNFSLPLLSTTSGKCEGCVVLAQQATCFQPQIQEDVLIGRWRKVTMLRSASGTTPALKMYSDLPIYFQNAEVSFGVGFEPAFADVSYAFTVALRRANIGTRNLDSKQTANLNFPQNQQPKKERSLPWWDDVRYYIHGKICLRCTEFKLNFLATTDPYEKLDKFQIAAAFMDIQQSDGRVLFSSKEFKISISSLERLMNNYSFKLPTALSVPLLESPAFCLEVIMDWVCESGNPLNHYLHALPNEHGPRKKVFDPFRSTSLSLGFNFLLKRAPSSGDSANLDGAFYGSSSTERISIDCPTMNLGAHDLIWIFRWWNMLYNPPHKLRSFSRWSRFKIPRVPRSGNLSLDKVMTEFMLRVDATPACIKHVTLGDDDPASGLTFETTQLKYELCYSRGRKQYTFDCKRDTLDLVYQGLDLHMLKAFLNRDRCACISLDFRKAKGIVHGGSIDGLVNEKCNNMGGCTEKQNERGFLFTSDYFTIRRQTPKADPARLLAWQDAGRRNIVTQDAGRRNIETTYIRSEFENGSESDHTRSDPSDDDGFNVIIADNCQRVFVYGLKLLWTIPNRDAVWSWAGEISKAFESPKPSPSRQYAQRKLMEAKEQVHDASEKMPDDTSMASPPPSKCKGTSAPSPMHGEALGSFSSPSTSVKMECSSSGGAAKHGNIDDTEEDGTRQFMVNVIQPQFNLHSEEANGRFLLAAASGRVLARSFHSVLHVGYEMIEQALGTGGVHIPRTEVIEPEMTWKRVEFSVMLEHVQAHVAPTDVDPGAGLQWLAKIPRSSPKVKRTGALLERVFMPCTMYFRYTRHKGGTADLKVKPLKELAFNSPNITATMTSRQFQVMVDILSNLLFARLPKPRKSSLSYPADEDEDVEEEADEVVPDGVEEVELARINLELAERERKLLLDDIRALSASSDISGAISPPERDADLWMITGGKSILVQGLKKDLGNKQMSRKAASASLRMALQKAAQLRLMEEKNKSPSYAMRISLRINKVVWSMLTDGKAFAEAEINNMIYDFDRDYKDVGVAQFTTRFFVVRNCLPNAKSDMLLSAWNPPREWGKDVMLRVDAKQGAPKDGSSPIENFQVDIYPLKIHLTETMYRMMWEYFFPEEEQDSQRRQEVWIVSTTVNSRRGKKNNSLSEAAASSSHTVRESEVPAKSSVMPAPTVTSGTSHSSSAQGDTSQVSKLQNLKANIVCGANSELRRTSSFDKTWVENLAESVANELVLQVHSSSVTSSRSGPLNPTPEHHEENSKGKPKDSKLLKSGRPSHEEKKVGKSQEEKRSRARKTMEFHNIKISQVELLVTYEGSRFAVSDLRLLMDTFHRVDFNGTWRRLFSRVKKHIIWGVLKSVTGMQGKKFKDKLQIQRQENGGSSPDSDLNFSDSDGGQSGKHDQNPLSWFKKPSDGAGDGFVTSIRGLFNSQRRKARKAKAFVLRTMRGDTENEFHGEWSESDAEFSPFARQLTITKAKGLIRRHTKKFRSSRQKGAPTQPRESQVSSPRTTPYRSDSSGASSPYEDSHE